MKKSIKFIALFMISFVMMVVGKETVFAADSAPASFTAVSSKMTVNPKGLETNNISVKKIKNGMYIYCYDVNEVVPNNVVYTKKELITDPIINYIIASGRQDKTENEFFATQSALWIYLLENGKMKDTQYNYVAKIKKSMNNYPNEVVYKDISTILSKSKTYANYITDAIEISNKNVSFTLQDGYYVSSIIKVNKNKGDYSIKLVDAPIGTTYEELATGIRVRVPESSLLEGVNTFSLNVGFTTYNTYRYASSDSKYQDMLAAYPNNTSDTVKLSILKEKEEEPEDPTKIVISKQDITNKGVELPGATLVIKDSNGKVVEKWVSGNKPYEFDELPVGKYTLSETIAPEGYELSTETISFYVREDGKIEKVVMYNTPVKPEEPTKIVISKQDITNKGEELPGATLVIKDSNGKVVEKWVSGNKPYEFDKLPVGKYTLSETIAPAGYELSTETISFEVKEDGKIEKVVMYNTPEKVVENIVKISKQDITTGKELPGATLVIRDSNGKEIEKWVSTNEPYIIKGINEGTYTLEETIAPDGYKLSTEKITFEVKNNGVVTEVIMYNTPESTEVIVVPPTGSFASNIPYIIGGLVIIIGSVLIYRNAKKEQ